MMKVDTTNLNPNPNFKKPIFLSKWGEKKINIELNIHLFNEISCNLEILSLISKNLSCKMGALYTELSDLIKNANSSIKKYSPLLRWNT